MLPLPSKRSNRKRRGPHPYRALSASFCRNVGEAGRYCDGNGLYRLYLHMETSGSRRWVRRLVIRGRSGTLGLGSYRLVSLADARELALANRKVARSSGDPLAERRRADGVPTFAETVEKVIAIHSGIWRHPEKTKQQWRGCLRDHAYTRIGDKGVDKVTTADVMAVLLPLWTAANSTTGPWPPTSPSCTTPGAPSQAARWRSPRRASVRSLPGSPHQPANGLPGCSPGTGGQLPIVGVDRRARSGSRTPLRCSPPAAGRGGWGAASSPKG